MEHPLIKLSQKQIENIDKLNSDTKIKFNRISCLNCESENHMNLFTKDRYGLNVTKVLCNECGLMFINPMMSQNSSDYLYNSDLYRNILHHDEVEKNNLENWDKFENSEKKLDEKKSTFFNIINSLNIEYQTVCDVGAGNGQNVSLFKSIGKEACGYEPSKYFSEFGKKKNLNIINGFADDVEGEYDLVLMIHVLEHMINPKEVIRRLRKNVKKYLFVEVPASVDKFQSFQYSHTYYFSLNTLSQIITKCGFKKIYIEHKSRRVNDYVYALFEKTDEKEIYQYNYTKEVRKYKKIYYKYWAKSFIKRILRKILKKINPNIEKKIINIIDLRTLGDK
tara:strand:- start:538 stop:1545 length:1008 start_codon:yes stop_codon:yes gene_type:complete